MLLLTAILLLTDYIVKRSLREYSWILKHFVFEEEGSLAFLLKNEEV